MSKPHAQSMALLVGFVLTVRLPEQWHFSNAAQPGRQTTSSIQLSGGRIELTAITGLGVEFVGAIDIRLRKSPVACTCRPEMAVHQE
ncbi:hypothetical protein LZ31DRAFT_631652 [Colletotrichum somersetense]|nr:hypothetical protein LZ31DRAFT_631652 [Colletotrichum somersetense]